MGEANTTAATDYPRPSVTVDTVILALRQGALQVLLVQRKHAPFEGMWAIPGGFVEIDESLDTAARRELAEETGISDPTLHLEQLRAFGEPKRDPRTRVITVSYMAIVCADQLPVHAGSDAAAAAWFAAYEPPPLAFDHRAILSCATDRLRAQVQHSAAILRLLPPTFTLTDVQCAFERILGERLDKRNFRRKLLSSGALEATGELRAGDHRPARLYRARQDVAETLHARRLFP